MSAARIEPFADVYRSDLLALARTRTTISPVIPSAALTRYEVPGLGPDADGFASAEARLAFVDLVLSGLLEWELSVSDIVAERGHAELVSAIARRLGDARALRAGRASGPVVSSRTLEEAHGPLGLAWRDRPRDESERLGSRIEELVREGAGRDEEADLAEEGRRQGAEPPEGEIRDLMGYLRDFSQGGPFSAIGGAQRGEGSGRHEGEPPSSPGLWNGPFSEN